MDSTSAGAIVAALKAAGVSANDLLDTETGRSLIQQLEAIDPRIKRATDFFGPGGWSRIFLFRLATRHPTTAAIRLLAATLGAPLLAAVQRQH